MSRKKEEVFLKNNKKIKRSFNLNFRISFEDQRWLGFSVIGSFVLLIILNYIFPYKPIEKTQFEMKSGFFGVALTFLGALFLLNALVTGGEFLPWLIGAVLCIALLYFGLPLLFGFHW